MLLKQMSPKYLFFSKTGKNFESVVILFIDVNYCERCTETKQKERRINHKSQTC